jgi:tRNA-specific 2-thiouridylase
LTAADASYVSGYPPPGELRVTAKIRYKASETPAILTPLPADRVHVRFDELLRDITPGQSVVFYQGDVVLGGGVIDRP